MVHMTNECWETQQCGWSVREAQVEHENGVNLFGLIDKYIDKWHTIIGLIVSCFVFHISWFRRSLPHRTGGTLQVLLFYRIMTRNKPRKSGGSRGRGGVTKRRSRPPTAEQLDYEMELLRAKRENREKEFLEEQRKKKREKRKQTLDDEMDAYFAARDAPMSDEAAAKQTSAENK